MLSKFTRQDEPDCSLDLPRGDSGALIGSGQLGGLGCNALENVIDKGVHDGHGLLGDIGVLMVVSQYFEDVAGVGFVSGLALLGVFLLVGEGGFGGGFACGLLFGFGGWGHLGEG